MDQTHLGYTTWQDPPRNSLRAIRLAEVDVPAAGRDGRGGGRFGIGADEWRIIFAAV